MLQAQIPDTTVATVSTTEQTSAENQTAPPVSTMATPTSPGLTEGSITLTNVSLYSNCTTSIEASCTLPVLSPLSQCFTAPLVLFQRSGVSECETAKQDEFLCCHFRSLWPTLTV